MTVYNVTASTIVVDLAGVGPDGAVMDLAPRTVTVGPGGTVVLRDVVSRGIGALVIAGDGPFSLNTRVYSARAGGEVSSDVIPAEVFLDAESQGAFLAGLVANAKARTNIGFLAVANQSPLQIEVALLDATGVVIGARTFDVPAGSLAHVHISSRDIVPASFDGATGRVRVLSGDGVVTAYACVVDHTSGDGSFIPAAMLDSSSSTARQQHRLLLRRIAAEVLE
ncbi:MAG TPA: hypothetical protein VNL91_01365 [Thermoanaerobaculia bacterium]|nr:hypothetical protein [Thermoanaerobaculia bacterium]